MLNRPLSQAQHEALVSAGLEPVTDAPADEAYLVYSDRTWFTAEAVRRLVAAGTGRLLVEDEAWWASTGALQDTPRPGLYELAVLPAGSPPSLQVPPVVVDFSFEDMEQPRIHPSMRHALRPLRASAAMAHQIDHWSHIVRVNQLAIGARAGEAKLAWERAGFFAKVAMVLGILWRARSIRKDRILRALSEVPKSADIHPTAVVELCVIGEGVEIGPHAVVRASVLGDGAKVEEHATVNLSAVGEGATAGRFSMVNLSTLYPGAMVSCGDGFQCCVFGRDSFVAWGSTILDLSFGRPIKVNHDGARADSGQHFLGAAVGHRARIGNAVRVTYGAEVPNDAFLIPPPEGLIRDASAAPPDTPAHWIPGGGVAPIVKKRKGSNVGEGVPSESAKVENEGVQDDRNADRTDPAGRGR